MNVVAMGVTEYPLVLSNNVGRRVLFLPLGVRSTVQKGTGNPSMCFSLNLHNLIVLSSCHYRLTR